MDRDLNEESLYQIEERIRCLEGVIFRARQLQRRRQSRTPNQTTAANVQGLEVGVEGGLVNSGYAARRKATHLVAKALDVETCTDEAKNVSPGNFFDCNICLDMARDPVLTCCGHLFCWPCFYRLPHDHLNTKECPVCRGEVTETGITPIYGNASANDNDQLELKETGFEVPARPRAHRIESTRQQFTNQGSPDAMQNMPRIGNLFGGEILYNATDRSNISATQSRHNASNNHNSSSDQISRLLVQGAASFSSRSLAITYAEDSPESLFESFVHNYSIGIRQLIPAAVDRDSHFSIDASIQSETHNQEVAATNSGAIPSVSALSRNNDSNATTESNTWTTDSSSSTRGISSSPSSSSY